MERVFIMLVKYQIIINRGFSRVSSFNKKPYSVAVKNKRDKTLWNAS